MTNDINKVLNTGIGNIQGPGVMPGNGNFVGDKVVNIVIPNCVKFVTAADSIEFKRFVSDVIAAARAEWETLRGK